MTTYISPNIKKESARIDPEGNIINAQTKQIIEKNEVEAPQQVVESPELPVETPKPQNTGNLSSKIDDIVQAKIKARIDEIVEQRVNDALKNI